MASSTGIIDWEALGKTTNLLEAIPFLTPKMIIQEFGVKHVLDIIGHERAIAATIEIFGAERVLAAALEQASAEQIQNLRRRMQERGQRTPD